MLTIRPHITISWLAMLPTMYFTWMSVLDDDDEVSM
jgi:hypothetical protein